MNTFFRKTNRTLVTYREKSQAPFEDQVERYKEVRELNHETNRYKTKKVYKYETLDYVLTAERWKNNIKDVESDLHGILSKPNADHYPLTTKISIRLRAMIKKDIKNRHKLWKSN